MATPKTALNRLRKIALALPDTVEGETWGKPHFRVNGKIFCGYGEENGITCIGCKLEKKHAFKIVKQDGHWLSPFGGRHDWKHLASLINESYSLIAPKRSRAKLLTPAAKPSKTKSIRKK
ncbi:MAG: MmcQ/YjbR family DNA-binding protein [Limisphaerales bacterium]